MNYKYARSCIHSTPDTMCPHVGKNNTYVRMYIYTKDLLELDYVASQRKKSASIRT